jgi:DnaK suppressor protein
MLSKKKQEYFKKLLTQRLNELLEDANKTLTDMTDQTQNFPDPTDRASMESDRNFELRIRDRERRLISKINDGLDRIEARTYGICEECGGNISDERLKARPVTTENQEKVKGL